MSRSRFHVAGFALCALVLSAGPARAAPTDPAALFDEGVRKYAQAEYEGAADAFLRADEASPNVQALLNAIGAGRRGRSHLLVARASQRALQRPGASAELQRLAREALVEAAVHLARVEVSCAPVAAAPSSAGAGTSGERAGAEKAPAAGGAATATADGAATATVTAQAACAVSIDGAAVEAGPHYLLPGTHRFAGSVPGATPDEQPLTCNAGATYTVALRPVVKAAVRPAESAAPAPAKGSGPGWPREVVYVGAGVTAVLAGVSVWSGVDAIQAKDALPAVPLRAQNEDVLGRATRTNVLVAGTVIAALATAAAGVWLVSWESPGGVTKVGVAPSTAGLSAAIEGRF